MATPAPDWTPETRSGPWPQHHETRLCFGQLADQAQLVLQAVLCVRTPGERRLDPAARAGQDRALVRAQLVERCAKVCVRLVAQLCQYGRGERVQALELLLAQAQG